MDLRKFLALLLPSEGIYATWTSKDKTNRWAHSQEELAQQIESLSDEPGLYYAPQSFLEAGTGKAGRSGENIEAIRNFRIDIDAGQEKIQTVLRNAEKAGKTVDPLETLYEDQRSAAAALLEFIGETRLEPSLIVSSGEGLHVYWALDEDISTLEWRPVAMTLRERCAARGLKIDSGASIDANRLLRPVGALHKNGKRVKVLRATGVSYSFEGFRNAVGHREYNPNRNKDLERDYPDTPRSFKKLVQRCQAMRHAYQHQELTPEPLWRDVIGACKFTVEGLDAAHAMSKRHASYDPGETEDKYERWMMGPPLCRTLESNGGKCEGCVHKGKVNTPLVLAGITTVEAEQLPEEHRPPPEKPQAPTGNPWDNRIPAGYLVKKVGADWVLHQKLTVEIDGEDGQKSALKIEVPFSNDIYWFGQWTDAVTSDDIASLQLFKHTRPYTPIETDQTILASRQDLLKFLASKGVHPINSDKKTLNAMEAYARSSLELVRTTFEAPKITGRFGLRILDDGRLVAAQGPYLICPDGTIQRSVLSKELKTREHVYSVPLPEVEGTKWDASVWKEHLIPAARQHVEFMREFYTGQGMDQFQLALMLGIASPLMAFSSDGYRRGVSLPPNGFSVALYSDHGGKGKTSAMRCAQAAFGSVQVNMDGDQSTATVNGLMGLLSMSGTMPMNMDEMGDVEPKTLAVLIRTIANGASKIRAFTTGGVNSQTPWALTCLIGTNKSQREIINVARKTSSAEQFRIIEMRVNDIEFPAEVSAAYRVKWPKVVAQGGALGAVIHLLICGMGVEKANEFVQQRVNEAAEILQAVHEEAAGRFMHRGLGAALALHDLLETRDLAPFPRENIIRQFVQAYENTIDFVNDNVVNSDDLRLIAKMAADIHPNTIITHKFKTAHEALKSGYDKDIRVNPPNNPVARFHIEEGDLYVTAAALREWCAENRVSESALLGAAKHNNLLKRIYQSLSGTAANNKRWVAPVSLHRGMQLDMQASRVPCYRFDMKLLGKVLGDTQLEEMLGSGGEEDEPKKVSNVHYMAT